MVYIIFSLLCLAVLFGLMTGNLHLTSGIGGMDWEDTVLAGKLLFGWLSVALLAAHARDKRF